MENMEKIGLVKASKLTSPNPVSLFCTLRPDGGTNMAAISWWTFVSFAPDLLAVAMMKNGYSGELFRASGEAILTVPGVSLQEIALNVARARVVKLIKSSNLVYKPCLLKAAKSSCQRAFV